MCSSGVWKRRCGARAFDLNLAMHKVFFHLVRSALVASVPASAHLESLLFQRQITVLLRFVQLTALFHSQAAINDETELTKQQQQQQHLFRISRLHTEFYNFLYKWVLADLNLAN